MPQKFVSRAGAKLEHALEEFKLDVTGLRCADFGCNVGGFTDCLLQRGASHVTAIDTGYGALAWKLSAASRSAARSPGVISRKSCFCAGVAPSAGGGGGGGMLESCMSGLTLISSGLESVSSSVAALRSAEDVERIAAQVPLRRLAHVDDHVAAMLYLASDGAGFVTGVNIDTNGGRVML